MENFKAKVLEFIKDPVQRSRVLGILLIALTLNYTRKFFKFLAWRRDLLQRFTGPKPSLLLGNIPDIVKVGGVDESFFEWLHAKHGPVVGFFLGPSGFNLSISDPKHVQEVYKRSRSRPLETYMFLHYLGKDNLLFSHGEDMKQLRLRYGQMISNKDQLLKLHDRALEEFNKRTATWGDQKSVDLFYELSFLIYDVMGKVFFGHAWMETDVGPEIYRLHKYLIQNTNNFMIPGSTLVRLSAWLQFRNVNQKWRSMCNDLLEQHQAKIDADPAKYEKDESAMTMLLTSKDKDGELFFSRHRAVSTMCGFLNGAFDTTHCTSYWLFYHLAKYPHIQEKLKQEIRKVIGSRMDPTLEEARQIEYLQAYIYESMRHKVTVAINQRVNYEEDIDLGDFVIPKGTCVNIPQGINMKSHEYFGEDVDEFRPERFLPDDPYYNKAKFAWAAFGMHSRMCIGFTFALVELKVILISALQQYRVELADPSYKGLKLYEAGVNQPLEKALFRFIPSTAQLEAEKKNLEWWNSILQKQEKDIAQAA